MYASITESSQELMMAVKEVLYFGLLQPVTRDNRLELGDRCPCQERHWTRCLDRYTRYWETLLCSRVSIERVPIGELPCPNLIAPRKQKNACLIPLRNHSSR